MSSLSYWLDLPYTSRPPLTQDREVDAAVIGGGITGIATAYYCAKQGLTVALLEQQTLASGAAGRNGGMVVEGRSTDFLSLVAKFGIETASSLWQDTITARE